MKYSILPTLLLLILSSCEKEIQIDLNSTNPRYVIEASISDQPGPYQVKISKTINFSESSSYPAVENAVVVISDNYSQRDTLVETTPGTYETRWLKGIEGHVYHLEVSTGNKTFTSECAMPYKVKFDSISVNERSFTMASAPKSYVITPRFNDPVNQQNFYRFKQWINNFYNENILIADDYLQNGKMNKQPLMSFGLEINKGDTINIEMQSIDKNVYYYLFSLNQSIGRGPGSGTPANPLSNISGGALGYFSAYTQQRLSTILK